MFGNLFGGMAQGIASLHDSMVNTATSIANPILQHNQNIRNRKWSEGQANANRAFQREMSNTAISRGVADAENAGIHPWLVAGGGASTPAGSKADGAFPAPQINMPDYMAYGVSLKQLEQMDEKLRITDKKAMADIVKTLSDADLNEFKKIMLQKGAPKATLEGEAADLLRQGIRWLKESSSQNKQPTEIGGPR